MPLKMINAEEQVTVTKITTVCNATVYNTQQYSAGCIIRLNWVRLYVRDVMIMLIT